MSATPSAKPNGTDKKTTTDKAPPPPAADKAPAAAAAAAQATPAAPAATDAADPAATDAAAPAATDAEPKERQRVYIVVGQVHEFKNASEAEKFLNKDPAAPKDFVVIKGKKVEKKAKVSLR